MLRIEDELKNNQISRFQLLYGEERYMVQYYRNQLIEKLSNPDDEMNCTFFRDKPEPSQIAEAAQILPFFAENRLIVVEDSGYFKSRSVIKKMRSKPAQRSLQKRKKRWMSSIL